MSIEKAINKFIEITKSDVFVKYEKDFARMITSALSERYKNNPDERKIVKDIENIINNYKKLEDVESVPYFKLSTNAIFIHGYPSNSGVEFDYYGKNTPKELGDLIFIISVIFNNQKYFEKFTVTQFKRDEISNRTISWKIDKEQIYLLSRFPTFKGVKGSLVPQKDFNLSNYSGCLGSYGLLYRPGDFAYVGATRLDTYLNGSVKINGNDLFMLCEEKDMIEGSDCPYLWSECINLVDIYRYFCNINCGVCNRFLPKNVLGNSHSSGNVFDFVDKYLRLCIGEPIIMKIGRKNTSAKNFLYELLSVINIKAKKENMTDILSFCDTFFKNQSLDDTDKGGSINDNTFDFNVGGIRIIHTVINLGE